MQPIINIATKAVREAGTILVRALERLDSPTLELNRRHQVVTRVLSAAEETIIEIIHQAYPEHQFQPSTSNSEATPPAAATTQAPLWQITPVTGLLNYMRALPYFAIVVTMQQQEQTQHCLVYDPLQQELFTASHGAGAALNNHRIRVSTTAKLSDAIFGCSDSKLMPTLAPVTASTLNSGCPTLDLAYVAAGRLDGFCGTVSDLAAGKLLLQEAGGIVQPPIFTTPKLFKTTTQLLK